jgi:hypothetical protein
VQYVLQLLPRLPLPPRLLRLLLRLLLMVLMVPALPDECLVDARRLRGRAHADAAVVDVLAPAGSTVCARWNSVGVTSGDDEIA